MYQKIDLKTLAAHSEANFWRLQAVMRALFEQGEVTEGEQRVLTLPALNVALSLNICEVARYTVTIRLEFQTVSSTNRNQPLEFSSGFKDLLMPKPMVVRIYQDAQVAEVVDFAGLGAGRLRYQYPNERMLQPDEKLQQNRILGQWLAYGMAHGVPAGQMHDANDGGVPDGLLSAQL